MSRSVCVIGGGAAGLATAIFLARERRSPIAVVDGARKLGAKILVSGGGRCNVTNRHVTERDFWGGKPTIVRQILKAFPVDETIAWFHELGVPLHEEADGKLFPDSNRARDVLDALVADAHRLGITIVTGRRVRDVVHRESAFQIVTDDAPMSADIVVLASGGRSLPKSGSDGAGYAIAERLGHTIVATTPGLVPLVLSDADPALHKALAGVAHDAALVVWMGGRATLTLTGALLWTHFGVSGPVALNASRHWARARLEGFDTRVTVNFRPGLSFEQVDDALVAAGRERPRASAATVLASWLPASVASALAAHTGADALPLAQLARDVRRQLTHALVEWPLPIVDTRGYTYAEVTAGGVSLDEISPRTMESRIVPGLFLVGEILDVDGRIGGFNFQWAWASARVAARGITTRLDARVD